MTNSISGYDTFRLYQTIKLHYKTKSFTVEKYGYSSKVVSESKYESLGNKKVLFEKLGKQFKTKLGLSKYLACQLFWDSDLYISDICDKKDPVCEKRWLEFKKFLMAPEYYAKNDFQKMIECGSREDIIGSSEKLPKFVDMIMSEEGTVVYTVALLFSLFDFESVVDSEVGNHIVWDSLKYRIRKLSYFVIPKDVAKYNVTKSALLEVASKINPNRPE